MKRARQGVGNGVVTIASKVTKDEKAKIKTIADAFGMSFYELLQSLLLALLRYFDSDSLVTYDHNCMMNAFANTMYAMKDSYSPFGNRERDKRIIKSAILFVEESPKKSPQLLSVVRNADGKLMESWNFDKMVADFLRCVDPDCLNRLEAMKTELGYFSITHTLHEIIMQRTSSDGGMKADIKDMFSDMRIPSGQAVNEDVKYKRGYRQNVDEYTTIQQRQTFRADL